MGAIALRPLQFLSILVLAVAFMLSWQSSVRQAAGPQFNIKEVTALEAKELIDAGAVVVDVRDRAVAQGNHLPGAMLIPLEVISAQLAQLEAARAKSIVVYCGDGSTRGPEATSILNKAGFAQAVNLKPGIEGWRSAGLPTTNL